MHRSDAHQGSHPLMAALIRTRLSFLASGLLCAPTAALLLQGIRPVYEHKNLHTKKAGAAGTPISGMLTTPAIWYLTFGSVAR